MACHLSNPAIDPPGWNTISDLSVTARPLPQVQALPLELRLRVQEVFAMACLGAHMRDGSGQSKACEKIEAVFCELIALGEGVV